MGPKICDPNIKYTGVFVGTDGGASGDRITGSAFAPQRMADAFRITCTGGTKGWGENSQDVVVQRDAPNTAVLNATMGFDNIGVTTDRIAGYVDQRQLEMEPGDEFVFYIAAHGIVVENAPIRERYPGLTLDGEDMTWSALREILSGRYAGMTSGGFKRSVTVTVVIDACHAGAFWRELFHSDPTGSGITNRNGDSMDIKHLKVLMAVEADKCTQASLVGRDEFNREWLNQTTGAKGPDMESCNGGNGTKDGDTLNDVLDNDCLASKFTHFLKECLRVGMTSRQWFDCTKEKGAHLFKEPRPPFRPTPPVQWPLKGPPAMKKSPELSNVFLSNQPGPKLGANCEESTDVASLDEVVDFPIITPDPKGGAGEQQLAAFEFEVRFDNKLVCVNILPGIAAANMVCVADDKDSSLLEGIARVSCVTQKGQPFPDTFTQDGRQLATIEVRPTEELYSQIIANQENGAGVSLLEQNCELADQHGHPIAIAGCADAGITVRWLEGDVNGDCNTDAAADGQLLAFRWGAEFGNLLYNERYDLEPSADSTGAGVNGDGDVDVKDIQFVFGRHGSSCDAPNPPQEPVNPKAQP